MARPALDLPDPINDTPPQGTAGAHTSADDLLAQLAGEEIDRLLADADDDLPTTPNNTTPTAPRTQNIDRPVPPKPPAKPTPAANTAPEAPAKPAPSPFNGAAAGPTPSANPTANPTPNPTDDAILAATEEALDDLFKELDDETNAATPTPAPFSSAASAPLTPSQTQTPSTPTAPTTALAQQSRAAAAVLDAPSLPARTNAPPSQPASAADALAAELEADEAAHAAALQRMKKPGGSAIVTAAPIEIDPDVIDVETEPPTATDHDDASAPAEVDESTVTYPRIPLIVRILEIVNSPLASLPPTAREAVGKIALITTLNAIAVLTYVLLFRHPH